MGVCGWGGGGGVGRLESFVIMLGLIARGLGLQHVTGLVLQSAAGMIASISPTDACIFR
jgi:hypothetical protein